MPSSQTAETTRLRKSSDKGPIPRRLQFGAPQESHFQCVENADQFNPAGNRSNVDAKTVREKVVTNASRKSALMTDKFNIYTKLGREFSSHHAVDHTRDEYAYFDRITGRTVSINVSENFFSIFKRGITGVYHSISEAHLHRYLAEFDFRYNNRSKLGVEDTERAAKAVLGAEGKRLTYNQPLI